MKTSSRVSPQKESKASARISTVGTPVVCEATEGIRYSGRLEKKSLRDPLREGRGVSRDFGQLRIVKEAHPFALVPSAPWPWGNRLDVFIFFPSKARRRLGGSRQPPVCLWELCF